MLGSSNQQWTPHLQHPITLYQAGMQRANWQHARAIIIHFCIERTSPMKLTAPLHTPSPTQPTSNMPTMRPSQLLHALRPSQPLHARGSPDSRLPFTPATFLHGPSLSHVPSLLFFDAPTTSPHAPRLHPYSYASDTMLLIVHFH